MNRTVDVAKRVYTDAEKVTKDKNSAASLLCLGFNTLSIYVCSLVNRKRHVISSLIQCLLALILMKHSKAISSPEYTEVL